MSRLLAHAQHNAVAYLALFVALSGTSYAAIAIPAGSVGTRQLRNRAVTESKLGKGSVSAANLDSKSIAGYVAFWAQIRADGQVIASSPHATVTTDAPRGLEQVYWHRAISPRCIAVVNPTNVAPVTESATAYATGPYGHGSGSYFFLSTFDGSGANVPENVNIVVTCP